MCHLHSRSPQVLWRDRGGKRHRPRGRARRGLRLPRSERGRQDAHGRDPRGVPHAQRGEVSVLGEDPERAGRAWRDRIGIVLQTCRLDPYLTARESLELYAGYYSNPRPVDEVIELVGLGGKAEERTGRLSGGQQRRLDVGMALVGDPELLFLDEPTTGFDPAARRQAWEAIAGLRELGKTVFLTTHYMDEAQRLADRVAILAGGEVVARGAPEELGDRDSQPTVIIYRGPEGEVSLTTTTPVQTLNELTGRALAEGFDLEGLEVKRASLEDVYLDLTEQPTNGAVEQGVPRS
ncbi:MAG TPA: ABC transporter ATP-binding protein [Solirubrobacterales bacterium]|nr:ABC transporter ATP-binding protein [Solirubrobacterales bacterium]